MCFLITVFDGLQIVVESKLVSLLPIYLPLVMLTEPFHQLKDTGYQLDNAQQGFLKIDIMFHIMGISEPHIYVPVLRHNVSHNGYVLTSHRRITVFRQNFSHNGYL